MDILDPEPDVDVPPVQYGYILYWPLSPEPLCEVLHF